MGRVLKPETSVYSTRVPKELKKEIDRLSPDNKESLRNGVINLATKFTDKCKSKNS